MALNHIYQENKPVADLYHPLPFKDRGSEAGKRKKNLPPEGAVEQKLRRTFRTPKKKRLGYFSDTGKLVKNGRITERKIR